MNTRAEIIKYLQSHPYSCADELSTVLGQTRANIQRHLKIMERGNIISQVSVAQSQPMRGRPRDYFCLTPINRPNNLASLTETLLQLLFDQGNDEAKTQVIEKIAQHVLRLGGAPSTLTQRLNRMIKELSGLGYQARWEAHADGPQVVFRNCPYHPLPDKFPELCRMDALLLMHNLGVSEPIQTDQIHIPTITACRFTIKES